MKNELFCVLLKRIWNLIKRPKLIVTLYSITHLLLNLLIQLRKALLAILHYLHYKTRKKENAPYYLFVP